MKKIYLIFSLFTIMFFFEISNLRAIDIDGAISVDVLPTCDSTNVNNVYALSTDNHYHQCKFVPGGLRNILVGDDLTNKIIYFDFPNDYYTNVSLPLVVSSYSYITTSYSNIKFEESIFINSNSNTSGLNVRLYTGCGTCRFTLYSANVTNNVFNYTSSSVSYDLGTGYYSRDKVVIVDFIDSSHPAYQYIKITSGDSYTYEDLGEITFHIYYNHIDRDFYLFYDFDTISTFDIFSSYDFSSFNDFQKLVVVIGINTFYLCFLGLCVYILIKLINKLLSWII